MAVKIQKTERVFCPFYGYENPSGITGKILTGNYIWCQKDFQSNQIKNSPVQSCVKMLKNVQKQITKKEVNYA